MRRIEIKIATTNARVCADISRICNDLSFFFVFLVCLCMCFWHKPFQCYSYVRPNCCHYPHHFPNLWPQMRYPNRRCQMMYQFFYNFADPNAPESPNGTNSNMIHPCCGTFDRMVFLFHIHLHRIHNDDLCTRPDTDIVRVLRICHCCDTVSYKLLKKQVRNHNNEVQTK